VQQSETHRPDLAEVCNQRALQRDERVVPMLIVEQSAPLPGLIMPPSVHVLAPPTVTTSPTIPTKSDVLAVLPAEVFEINTVRSMRYAISATVLTLIPALLAWQFLPLTWAWLPAWIVYALVTGTLACGVWVIAHECGHGAFSKNKFVQDSVGFVLHSSLLVPYFSWQRSHAMHHAKTNHLTDGETHVPLRADTAPGKRSLAWRRRLGTRLHATLNIAGHLLVGWPVYLLTGATSGGDRPTNHFWPWKPFASKLFPARFAKRVLASGAGVFVVIALLTWWALATSPMLVVALYGGPYLVNNAWLVGYTWLHHTGANTPHLDGDQWSYVRGAFSSIDRPYGRLFDTLHHRIGSTHAAHHLVSRIPHYHAEQATVAIKEAFPDLYQYDPTPVPKALWRLGKECVAVAETDDGWFYVAEIDDAVRPSR